MFKLISAIFIITAFAAPAAFADHDTQTGEVHECIWKTLAHLVTDQGVKARALNPDGTVRPLIDSVNTSLTH